MCNAESGAVVPIPILLLLFRDVKFAPDKLAFKSNAVCCAVLTGLFASDVLLQFPNPTIAAVIPVTVPEKRVMLN